MNRVNLPDRVHTHKTRLHEYADRTTLVRKPLDAEERRMSQDEMTDSLPESKRKEIFQALVEAQDQEMSVSQSRQLITEKFGVSDAQLRDIEREGLDNQWPPL